MIARDVFVHQVDASFDSMSDQATVIAGDRCCFGSPTLSMPSEPFCYRDASYGRDLGFRPHGKIRRPKAERVDGM